MHDHKPTPDPAGIRPTLEAPSLDEAYRKTEIKSVANSAPRVLRTPAEPRQIGRFAVQGRLGQGGMGVVYAAYDEGLDRRVAVKLLHATIDGPTGHNRLRQEARSLAQLSHPNVVPVYEVGIHENTPYLAMELVEGQTLREWVEAQTRPNIALLAMYLEIGRGLQATHNVGVIHRDFKPDNVLIGDDGRPRIVDFGLARVGPPKAVRPAPVAP
ncbi:MAG: serine/threonine-protein kinase, partial [Nannocystaceae bacterium]